MIKKHTRLFSILVVLVLVVVVFCILVLPGIFKFKTVIYSNGLGSDFTLKFYSSYHKDKGVEGQPNLVSLVSEGTMYGKAPIELYIVQSSASNNLLKLNNAKYCNGTNSAFSVHNGFLNTNIRVCSVNVDGVPSTYTAYFDYSSTMYLATVDQPYSTLLSAENKQGYSGLSTTFSGYGVAPYQGDVAKMLGSIKVLD